MALIDFTGFEDQLDEVCPTFYDNFGGNSYYMHKSSVTRYDTGISFTYTAGSCNFYKYLDDVDVVIFGMALIASGGASQIWHIANDVSQTSNIRLDFSTLSGKVSAIRGVNSWDTLLGESALGCWNYLNWNYFEVKARINDSTGMIVVRVNNSVILNLTNIDTYLSGNASIGIINNILIADVKVDDAYVCDDTGSECNDFLGEIIVDAIVPTANGNQNDGTASSGSNYECVDELEPNDDTDYVTLDAINEIELYTMGDLPSTSYTKTIYGVKVIARGRKTDTGTRELKGMLRINSTDYVHSGDSLIMATGYATKVWVWTLNPDDSQDFEEADVNAMQAGIKVTV